MCTTQCNWNLNASRIQLEPENATDLPMTTRNGSEATNATIQPSEDLLSEDSEVGLMIIFTLTTLLSIIGNSFVIIVFARGRRSRTDLRPFLINLAISDLIMAIFCMPFTFIYTMMNRWIFSKPMCPIVLFVQPLSVCGSVFTNMAIGIDRFMAVTFPLRSRLTKKRAKYVICVIWIGSIAISSVQFKVALPVELPGGVIHCQEHWDDMEYRKIYTVSLFVITYLIPLLILSITYSIVGILLWKRITPGNRDHARDMQQLRSKRKVVKMLIIVVAMFGICWLPLHMFTLLLDFRPEIHTPENMKTLTTIYISFHWLAMSNSFANPIIYGFTNESFRADLVTLFYIWFPCCLCLTRMIPRHSSGSTYETVVFRRQSTYKHGTANGSIHSKSTFSQRNNKRYLNRNRLEYENIKDERNRKLANGCNSKVLQAMDRNYLKLQPITSNDRLSDNDYVGDSCTSFVDS